MKELSKIIQRRRDYHLIIRTARNLENMYSYELTDDLGINSDSMPAYNRLKHQPAVIILNHHEVGIE
jgi:ribosome-binding protein aMBF1 (putative translation factor)